jgi:arsenite methyltransferase
MTSFDHDSSSLAEAYDKLSDSQFEGGTRMVARMAIAVGERVLDVGCGTGRLARFLADRVGPAGGVAGIDPLAERVAIARAQAPAIRFEVGRAEDLSAFADESFDAVVMSAMFHWVDDKPRALAEARRVLRLGMTTLSRETMNATTIAGVLQAVLIRPAYAGEVDLSKFALVSRGHTTTELLNLVSESGLRLAEFHVVSRERVHPSGAEAVDFLESSSFGNFLRIVPEHRRAALRDDLAAAFEALRGPNGVTLEDWGTSLGAHRPRIRA